MELPAKLKTGAPVKVPLFLDQGDVIKVDTRSGEYLGEFVNNESLNLFENNWRPQASQEVLLARSKIITSIRNFFAK